MPENWHHRPNGVIALDTPVIHGPEAEQGEISWETSAPNRWTLERGHRRIAAEGSAAPLGQETWQMAQYLIHHGSPCAICKHREPKALVSIDIGETIATATYIERNLEVLSEVPLCHVCVAKRLFLKALFVLLAVAGGVSVIACLIAARDDPIWPVVLEIVAMLCVVIPSLYTVANVDHVFFRRAIKQWLEQHTAQIESDDADDETPARLNQPALGTESPGISDAEIDEAVQVAYGRARVQANRVVFMCIALLVMGLGSLLRNRGEPIEVAAAPLGVIGLFSLFAIGYRASIGIGWDGPRSRGGRARIARQLAIARGLHVLPAGKLFLCAPLVGYVGLFAGLIALVYAIPLGQRLAEGFAGAPISAVLRLFGIGLLMPSAMFVISLRLFRDLLQSPENAARVSYAVMGMVCSSAPIIGAILSAFFSRG